MLDQGPLFIFFLFKSSFMAAQVSLSARQLNGNRRRSFGLVFSTLSQHVLNLQKFFSLRYLRNLLKWKTRLCVTPVKGRSSSISCAFESRALECFLLYQVNVCLRYSETAVRVSFNPFIIKNVQRIFTRSNDTRIQAPIPTLRFSVSSTLSI